jgi:ubiquinone/menaquinone biosynthesis C-methylase UbiE
MGVFLNRENMHGDVIEVASDEQKKLSEMQWGYYIANKYDFFFGDLDSSLSYFLTDKFIDRPLSSKEYVLDVGCGTGNCINHLTRNNACRAVGLDLSKELIKIAKIKTRSRAIDYVIADAEKLPFKNNSFDIIICWYTLHHLQNTRSCFKEINRTLNSNAYFLAIEQGNQNVNTPDERLNHLLNDLPTVLRIIHQYFLGVVNKRIKELHKVLKLHNSFDSPYEKPLPARQVFRDLLAISQGQMPELYFVFASAYKQKPWFINKCGLGDIFIVFLKKIERE